MLKEEGEKSMRKRGLGSKILCGVLVFGLCFNVPYSSAAAGESVTENGFIADGELQNNSTPEPEAWGAVPNANQYQKEEMAAFCHFGPNTFNEVEWGENYGDKTPDEIFSTKLVHLMQSKMAFNTLIYKTRRINI